MNNLKYLLTPLFAICILNPFIFAQADATCLENATNTNCSKYEFEIPILPFSSNVNGVDYFWFFGDGTWSSSPIPQHAYSSNSISPVYVEVTPVSTTGGYQDTDQPRRFMVNNNGTTTPFQPTCNASSCSGPQPPIPSSPLDVMINRKLVIDNMVTYTISYNNDCTEDAEIKFEYDPAQLLKDPIGNFPVELASSPPYIFTWNIAPGSYGNIFVRMKVNDVGVELDETIAPKITMEYPQQTCSSPAPISAGTQVASSHDPNVMVSSSETYCDNTYPTIRYTIRFQNFGDAPADSVMITNVLSGYYFDVNSIVPIYPEFNGVKLLPSINQTDNSARWKLTDTYLRKGNKLRGKTEPDYGTVYKEETTIDSIVFVVPVKNTTNLRACEAIINQAEIVFDCNPAIKTNAFVSRVGCELCVPCPDADTVRMDEIVLNIPSGQNTATIQLAYDQSKSELPAGGNLKFRWYPSLGLNNVTSNSTQATLGVGRDYFLTAWNADSCDKRQIFHYPVVYPCGMDLTETISCYTNGDKKITVDVTGTPNTNALKWNINVTGNPGCTFGQQLVLDNLDMDRVTLSVVDTVTNCYVMKTFELTCPSTPSGPTLPGWLKYLAIGFALILIYLILKKFKG